jgi:23S rRNA (uracil1939-C5)-methyltransferase
MVLPEEDQRAVKAEVVRDALERIGRFPGPLPIEPVLPVGSALGYRNRIELALGIDSAGRRAVGFHGHAPDGSPALVDVPHCLLEAPAGDRALTAARSFLLDPALAPDACFTPREPYRLLIRSSGIDGRVIVAVREAGAPFPVARELAEHLVQGGHAAGFVRLAGRVGRRGRTAVVPVAGVDRLTERIGAFAFDLPAGSFVQVDARGATALVELVAAAVAPSRGARVVDLYAGVGAYALTLAAAGARAVAVEADRDAVACGEDAARRAGVDVRFVPDDVGRSLASGIAGDADAIVANPPRTGFGPGVADAIASSSASRVAIVSCDPATLARDLARLVPPYRIERVQPIDLFPQTAHVECVVTLRRV